MFPGATGGEATLESNSELSFVNCPRGGGDAKPLSGRNPGGGPLGSGGRGDKDSDCSEDCFVRVSAVLELSTRCNRGVLPSSISSSLLPSLSFKVNFF